MTIPQKIKKEIIENAASWKGKALPPLDETNIDEIFDAYDNQDCKEEFRSSGQETDLESEWSGHYESKSVGSQLRDGTWVGWTYWFGGGKHGHASEIEWIEDAYELECEEVMRPVLEFKKL